MEFLHAGLLGLTVLAAVPVLLHLLHRPKPKERPFPSLLFLQRCARKSRRLARLRNLILLLLRAGAVAGIAIAVARPRLTGAATIAEGGVAVGIVLDDSFRMGYCDGGHSRFEEARRRALDLMAALPAGTECALACASGDSTALLPDPSVIRSELLRAKTSDSSSSLLPAILDAARSLEESRTERREIHVFTDLARTAWTGKAVEDLRGIAVTVHDVGKEGSVNAAVTQVELTPNTPRAGRPVEIAATARGWGRGGPASIGLRVGDRTVDEKPISIPDGGTATVRFRWTPETDGVFFGAVSLGTPDPLQADDTRHFAAALGDPLRLLVVEADAETPFLTFALAPPRLRDRAPAIVTSVEQTEIDPTDVAAVLLGGSAGITKDAVTRLSSFVSAGGGLAVFASAGVERLTAAGLYPAVESTLETQARLAPGACDHAILRSFRAGRNGDLASATFARRLRLRADSRWRPVLVFDDGVPAILEASFGRGRLLAFAFGLVSAELPKFPCFVPLVHETARHLAGSGLPSRDFKAGVPVVVPLARPPSDPAYTFVDLTNGRREERLADSTVGALSVARSLPPGPYLLERSDGRRAFSVNLDPAGSDPTRIARQDLALLIPGVTFSASPAIGETPKARRAPELAPFVLVAICVLFLIELWLVRRS